MANRLAKRILPNTHGSTNIDGFMTPDGLGLGTDDPQASFHLSVSSGSLPTLSANTALLVQDNLTTSNGPALTLLAGNASVSRLFFGDTDDENVGRVLFNHTDDTMRIFTGGSESGRFDGSFLGVNETSPDSIIHATGNVSADDLIHLETNGGADALKVGDDESVKTTGVLSGGKQTTTLAAAVTTFAITTNFVVLTGDAGANTLATITGGIANTRLVILFVDGLITITDDNTHAANSIDLSGAFTSADDTTLDLIHDGTSWYETSRSVN